MSKYETGTLHGHNWVKVPYEDLYKNVPYNKAANFVVIISGPGRPSVDDAQIATFKRQGYGYDTGEKIYRPYYADEIRAICGEQSPLVFYYGFPCHYSKLDVIESQYPLPDDVKGAFDIHPQSKRLRINFRTTNRAGVEVSKPYNLDPKNFIEDEIEKAVEWARTNAPKPAEDVLMASSFTNAIMRLGDDFALGKIIEAQFDKKDEMHLRIPGAHFASASIDSVTFKKLKTANRVMTEIAIGHSTIVEDASGITVHWHATVPEGAVTGLSGQPLGDLIAEDWAKDMKIRKAEAQKIERAVDNQTTAYDAIKVRASIAYEPFELPEGAQVPDYAAQLARHIETFLSYEGNKIRTELTWLLDTMDTRQKAIAFSQMINPDNEHIYLDDLGLKDWTIQRGYGGRYQISRAPDIEGDDLASYLAQFKS